MAIDTLEFDSADDVALADKMNVGRKQIIAELQKRIVGQSDVVELVLVTLFVGGNSLIVGVPGLAKTLLIATLAKVLDLKFNRIQFTPDLMPSDITGTDIINEDVSTGRRQMVFAPGPVFSNIVLADEINRTPPKTQAALLEAMQEHQVTSGGVSRKLDEPFFVLATQNPIELEGTYPLPEAQLDRFLFNAVLDDLSADDELKVIDWTTATRVTKVEPVTSAEDLLDFQQLVRMVPIAETLSRHVISLVRGTRHLFARPTSEDGGGWFCCRATSLAGLWLQSGIRGVPRLRARRRFAPRGLEPLRAHRTMLPEALSWRDQRPAHYTPRRE